MDIRYLIYYRHVQDNALLQVEKHLSRLCQTRPPTRSWEMHDDGVHPTIQIRCGVEKEQSCIQQSLLSKASSDQTRHQTLLLLPDLIRVDRMCSRSGSTSSVVRKAGPNGWTMVSTRPCLVQMPARPSILRNIRYLSTQGSGSEHDSTSIRCNTAGRLQTFFPARSPIAIRPGRPSSQISLKDATWALSQTTEIRTASGIRQIQDNGQRAHARHHAKGWIPHCS